MHELSIVTSVVRTVAQAAEEQDCKVTSVLLRVGALSGLVTEALLFGWELATAGTRLEGAALEVESVPIAIYCEPCAHEMTLPGVHGFRCPVCDTPSGNLRHGRELEIASVTVLDAVKAA